MGQKAKKHVDKISLDHIDIKKIFHGGHWCKGHVKVEDNTGHESKRRNFYFSFMAKAIRQ